MKRLLLVFFVLVATGCAHVSEYPLPEAPQFSTSEGENCATKCRGIHFDCKEACKGSEKEQALCVSECNKELGGCYELCKELLE